MDDILQLFAVRGHADDIFLGSKEIGFPLLPFFA